MLLKINQSQFMKIFSVLPDPRNQRNQLYSLSDILNTAILAVICGYQDWENLSLWTKGQLHWLQSIGLCLQGAPSLDTYNRFFRFLDPTVMEACFMEWTQSLVEKIKGIIAIE